ncbi:MAG: N-acetylmuramic acid 6-phosphate etherase [bacterium]
MDTNNLILTEKRNDKTVNIDLLPSLEIVKLINNEDLTIAKSVEKELPTIAAAIDIISENFLKNGSLLYFGAGTSGRLGVLDASECPPTFGVAKEMVRGYIAGGETALRNAVEGAEDSEQGGIKDLIESGAKQNDTVVGLSASGNAPYVVALLKRAQEMGIKTIGVACNKMAKMREYCDVFIAVEVGPEPLTGSTRMKAGTAQKMVLNMLSTASMVKIGKTYQNYMIDVQPTNVKLRDRAVRIVSEITDLEYETAHSYLQSADYRVKHAVLMAINKISYEEADELLQKHNGVSRKALKN